MVRPYPHKKIQKDLVNISRVIAKTNIPKPSGGYKQDFIISLSTLSPVWHTQCFPQIETLSLVLFHCGLLASLHTCSFWQEDFLYNNKFGFKILNFNLTHKNLTFSTNLETEGEGKQDIDFMSLPIKTYIQNMKALSQIQCIFMLGPLKGKPQKHHIPIFLPGNISKNIGLDRILHNYFILFN